MNDSNRPALRVFAGPNGAGKSTLISQLKSGGMTNAPVLDADAHAKNLTGTDAQRNLEAGRWVIAETRAAIAEGRSFIRETTLTSWESQRTMFEAKEAGYRVDFHYVGADSVKTTMARVEERVRKGGHDISETTQARRFETSLKNAGAVLSLTDRATFYDNTSDRYRIVATAENGRLTGAVKDPPNWLSRALGPEILASAKTQAYEQRGLERDFSRFPESSRTDPTRHRGADSAQRKGRGFEMD